MYAHKSIIHNTYNIISIWYGIYNNNTVILGDNMKEKTSLILGEVGSVKVLNENKKEVFITPEHLKIGKLKLSEILANNKSVITLLI